jgi:iron complex transport system substrate-binding protein
MKFTLKPNGSWPERIVCLTSETTELVFALGAGERIVGVSGYSVHPPEAREKEKVASFITIRMDKIRKLQPDLIVGFSDLQKDIARDLIAEGFNVFISNQRSLKEIGDTILAIGRLIGAEKKAHELRDHFFKELAELGQNRAASQAPRVYFEEWDEPFITGIAWVSELIQLLGAEDVFQEKSRGKTAKERTVTSEEIVAANPDVILASWCGKKMQKDIMLARAGWEKIKAVQTGRIHEIKSADILGPGIGILRGARQMAGLLSLP